MVRKLFGVLCVAVALCFGAVLADEISGLLVRVDTAKKTVTVKDKDGKETIYEVAPDAKIVAGFGRGKGGGGGGKGRGEPPPPGTLETLQAAVEASADRGGYNAKMTRDEKTNKITEIQNAFGAGRRGKGGR